MQEELVFSIIAMLSQGDQLHGYHTQHLYLALSNDISQVNKTALCVCVCVCVCVCARTCACVYVFITWSANLVL